MKKLLIGSCIFAGILSAHSSVLDCKNLSQKAVVALGKVNSGSAMKFDSIEEVSVKKTEHSTKTYVFKIYLKDPNADAYDGYYVTAQSFSDDEGCLVKKVEMFQYD